MAFFQNIKTIEGVYRKLVFSKLVVAKLLKQGGADDAEGRVGGIGDNAVACASGQHGTPHHRVVEGVARVGAWVPLQRLGVGSPSGHIWHGTPTPHWRVASVDLAVVGNSVKRKVDRLNWAPNANLGWRQSLSGQLISLPHRRVAPTPLGLLRRELLFGVISVVVIVRTTHTAAAATTTTTLIVLRVGLGRGGVVIITIGGRIVGGTRVVTLVLIKRGRWVARMMLGVALVMRRRSKGVGGRLRAGIRGSVTCNAVGSGKGGIGVIGRVGAPRAGVDRGCFKFLRLQVNTKRKKEKKEEKIGSLLNMKERRNRNLPVRGGCQGTTSSASSGWPECHSHPSLPCDGCTWRHEPLFHGMAQLR